MENPGKVLKAKRLDSKLSSVDVAGKLKISLKQLEALETNNFEVFAGPVFVHGFIRNYAKLLEIDADPLVKSADEILNPPIPEPLPEGEIERKEDKTRSKSEIIVVVLLAVFLLGSIGVVVFNSQIESSIGLRTKPQVLLSEQGSFNRKEDPLDSLRLEKNLVDLNEDKEVLEQGSSTGLLNLVFLDESWVEVRNGTGEVIFAELSPKGSERQVEGDKPFAIIIGNSAGVVLTFNGKEVDLAPHTQVSVARLVLE